MTDEHAHRQFLRHTLATLAYRAQKVLRDAPAAFASTRIAPDTRSAAEILDHLVALIGWALTAAKGEACTTIPSVDWEQDIARFYTAMQELDAYLASDAPLSLSAMKLFQGPIADSLTHVGQLATLRRVAGYPVFGESYVRAEVVIGRVDADQTRNP